MAKQPDIITIVAGSNMHADINANLVSIQEKFDSLIHRDGELPNFLETDINGGNVDFTNINLLTADIFTLNNEDLYGLLFGRNNAMKLQEITMTTNDILYYDAELDVLQPLAIGANGKVLKVAGQNSFGLIPAWADDENDDTDTVGVTVQEDGVTVATGVTQIDFTTAEGADAPYITQTGTGNGPGGGNEVSLDMTDGDIVRGDLYFNNVNLGNPTNFEINSSLADWGAPVVDLIALGADPADITAGVYIVDVAWNATASGGPPGFEYDGGGVAGVAFYNSSDVKVGEETFVLNPANKDQTKNVVLMGASLHPDTQYLRFDGTWTRGVSVTYVINSRSIRVYTA